jgi:hypothetical protein
MAPRRPFIRRRSSGKRHFRPWSDGMIATVLRNNYDFGLFFLQGHQQI